MRRRVALLIIAASAALLAGAVIFEGGPSPVIFPRQTLPLYFDHAYHTRAPDEARGIVGEGLDCDFCHENISEQATSGERDIPGHSVCESCHGDWIGDEETPGKISDCARCHKDLDPAGTSTRAAPMVIPPPNIKFAHKDHVISTIACTACHDQVPKKTLATRDDFPTMDRCIQCHQERAVSTECTTCHLESPTGKLVTSFPQGKLMPVRYHGFAAHTGDFLRDHAVPAQRDPAFCQTCHSQSECLECHDGVNRDTRFHPGDWMAVHGTRSRIDDFRCQSCHRLQSFCFDCHVRSGVASVIDPKTFNLTRQTIRTENGVPNGPHPMAAQGWLSPASRNFHGFHAQRSMRACVSCHQEQYCIRCHGSGFGTGGPSIGGNPHGPNPERLRNSAARNNNARACLKCHSPADPSWR